ncbi:MAG: hypothetical protein M3O91_02530, partial [Chloroflexota bacterium]|nr:hypothetical protein [Chloroflexota bacterium]
AGGNQVFDHWEGEVWCAGQGARCEVPEPPSELENYGHSVKAVFKVNPEWKSPFTELGVDSANKKTRLSKARLSR